MSLLTLFPQNMTCLLYTSLATPGTADSLPKTLQSLGRRYVQYFNYRYRRTGTLLEGRYRATVIEAETYLFECMRYIELNPVRANMVAHPAAYPWSSYRANDEGQADALLTPVSYTHLDVYKRQSDKSRLSAPAFSCAVTRTAVMPLPIR